MLKGRSAPTRTGMRPPAMSANLRKPGRSPVSGCAGPCGRAGAAATFGGGGIGVTQPPAIGNIARATRGTRRSARTSCKGEGIESKRILSNRSGYNVMNLAKAHEPMPSSDNSQNPLEAGLYLTATPIGHARDITLRALDVLKSCDLIAAEDTRVTARLLAIYAIAKPLRAYNDHNAQAERPRLIARLRDGARIALVSDAGTPLISDPGFKLVRAAIADGIKVHAVPGASAALAALSVAGLPSDRFLFAGFPPAKQGERRTFLSELKDVNATLIFYELPRRLSELLADMAAEFGAREACVARELTKLHEEVRRADLALLANAFPEPPKGEVTIVVAPPGKPEPDFAQADRLLDDALAFMPVRAAADLVAEALGLSRRETYRRALLRKNPANAQD